MAAATAVPYWRLSAFYFYYFAFLGAWVPYWSLYLDDEVGLSPEGIGAVSALVAVTRIVGPYCWGALADRTGQRTGIIRWGAGLALVCFSLLLLSPSWYPLLLIIGVYSFFWNAILAQFEAVTLSHLSKEPEKYSQVRLWGSVGFVASVFGLGFVFEWLSLRWLPHVLLFLLLGIWLSSLVVSQRRVETSNAVASGPVSNFWRTVCTPDIAIFFFVCFLMQMSHGPYYTFFSIYMEDLGYSSGEIGALWALGVMAEVLLFVFMHRLLHKFTLRLLLIWTLVLTVIRWFLIGYLADSIAVLLVAQLLHAASFGSFHAISIEFIRRRFATDIAGRAQAFYSASSYGVGGALGAGMSGFLWEEFGATAAFATAGLVVFVGLVAVLLVQSKGEGVGLHGANRSVGES
ncbi:putative 3-phenylpropionic acid transporter [BD1-7 clade bacterium]|uniref:Putative 3-phenylpropionic acid transporter n=1 Tax=BD1-7 clade bacterium TaxID=2029982 RepID=A0A5S9QM10_9GAMM|nr:putative 3-phenylpropionic acid transporter [BD1-7 clade bacterium]